MGVCDVGCFGSFEVVEGWEGVGRRITKKQGKRGGGRKRRSYGLTAPPPPLGANTLSTRVFGVSIQFFSIIRHLTELANNFRA